MLVICYHDKKEESAVSVATKLSCTKLWMSLLDISRCTRCRIDDTLAALYDSLELVLAHIVGRPFGQTQQGLQLKEKNNKMSMSMDACRCHQSEPSEAPEAVADCAEPSTLTLLGTVDQSKTKSLAAAECKRTNYALGLRATISKCHAQEATDQSN